MDRSGTKPKIVNIQMPVAGTEYSYRLPQGTGALMLKFRGGDGKYCYTANQSGSNFLTLYEGQNYFEDKITLDNTTLYFQSPVNGVVAEILLWEMNFYA